MKRGFTLIEILVAVVILGVIGSSIFVVYAKLHASKALESSVDVVVSALAEARSLTLAGSGSLSHGVYLDLDEVVLFSGVYDEEDTSNIVSPLHKLVGIREIDLSLGGSTITFERLTGETDDSGTLEVYLLASPSVYKTVSVSPTGVATADLE